ncbi:MAG: nuclear transport factor 2 family protein [Steroidobacter sp.]
MKKLFLLAILGGLSWWYFVGSRTIAEEHVTKFYQDLEHATLSRNPEAICTMLAEDFETVGTVSAGGRRTTSTQNKTQACESYKALYETFEQLGNRMGGMVQLDSSYKIHSISIRPDGKSAVVDYWSSLDVAGSLMNIRSRTTDTLIRRNGKVLILRSEGKGSIRTGGQ